MAASGKVVWVGRVISWLSGAVFLLSAVMKFKGGPELSEGIAKLGLPESIVNPLGILEIVCAVVYLVPATAALGAILLTGFLGGAILTHWRVGDPVIIHVVLGVIVWLGLWLRDDRLKALIPFRRP